MTTNGVSQVVDVEEPGKYRSLKGPWALCQKILFSLICVTGIPYILGVHTRVGLVVFEAQYAGLFLAITLALVFLSVRPTSRASSHRIPWYDFVLALGGLAVGLYLVFFYPSLVVRLGYITPIRVILGGLAILLMLEAVRRTSGWPLVVLLIFFLFYARFAYVFPGPFHGKGVALPLLLNYLYLDTNSMLGLLILGATIGLAFIFFGAVLLNFGGGKFLTDFAFAAMGRFRGGPAKAAVVGSSLVGTITGGAVANVMIVGTITIPMMKSTGYSAEKAAAIESVASTGGQIMPPIMGIAAFIMAEFLGVAYAEVALAALIPACLYYASVFVQVDLEAVKSGLKGLPPSELPRMGPVMKRGIVFVPIIAILVYTMFIMRLDAASAGAISALIALAISVTLKESRTGFWRKLLTALVSTGRITLDIAVILGAAGFIVGIMGISGLSFSLSMSLLHLAGGNVFLLLLLAAIASFVLGCGMPSVPCYVLVAVLVAPALVKMGILPMAAHLFVFYWSIVSNFTPPVAMAAFAAAALARCDPIRTGLAASKMAYLAYVIPFIFVFSPALLLFGTPTEVIIGVAAVVAGMWFLGSAMVGYLFARVVWWRRLLLALAGIVLFGYASGHLQFAIGVSAMAVGLLVILLEWLRKGKMGAVAQGMVIPVPDKKPDI